MNLLRNPRIRTWGYAVFWVGILSFGKVESSHGGSLSVDELYRKFQEIHGREPQREQDSQPKEQTAHPEPSDQQPDLSELRYQSSIETDENNLIRLIPGGYGACYGERKEVQPLDEATAKLLQSTRSGLADYKRKVDEEKKEKELASIPLPGDSTLYFPEGWRKGWYFNHVSENQIEEQISGIRLLRTRNEGAGAPCYKSVTTEMHVSNHYKPGNPGEWNHVGMSIVCNNAARRAAGLEYLKKGTGGVSCAPGCQPALWMDFWHDEGVTGFVHGADGKPERNSKGLPQSERFNVCQYQSTVACVPADGQEEYCGNQGDTGVKPVGFPKAASSLTNAYEACEGDREQLTTARAYIQAVNASPGVGCKNRDCGMELWWGEDYTGGLRNNDMFRLLADCYIKRLPDGTYSYQPGLSYRNRCVLRGDPGSLKRFNEWRARGSAASSR
jgi:hypothetical protein